MDEIQKLKMKSREIAAELESARSRRPEDANSTQRFAELAFKKNLDAAVKPSKRPEERRLEIKLKANELKILGLQLLAEAVPESSTVPLAESGASDDGTIKSDGLENDYTKLATRQQLIDAYGPFTGMSAEWFHNLRDAPGLRHARKVTGQGGRGHIKEPLFCPYEVMAWLIAPKRRKGREMSDDTAWRMLETHFPSVYAQYSIGDTRTD